MKRRIIVFDDHLEQKKSFKLVATDQRGGKNELFFVRTKAF